MTLPGAVTFAVAPDRWRAGSSGRESYHVPRSHVLSPEQEADLRRIAPGQSLRSLAVDFGVSHETVRAVLRR